MQLFFLDDIPQVDSLKQQFITAGVTLFIAVSGYVTLWLKNKKPNAKKQETLDAMSAQIEAMIKELSINGGETTIKDVVNKIHSKINTVEEKVDKVISQTRGRTELALNQSSFAQFLMNEKGELTFANDAMVELFGLGKNHLMRNKYLAAVDDQTVREEIIRRLGFAIEKQILFTMQAIPIRNNKANRTFKVSITIEPTLDDAEKFMWFLGKIKEQTET